MVNNVIILMTALVPTTGHADLIRFASHIPDSRVHVLVNGRSFEPVDTELRVNALAEHFATSPNVLVRGLVVDDAPQNPEDMPEGFWAWWREEICSNFPEVQRWDTVVASEPYGQQVADVLGAQFLPYDIPRALNPVKGTTVRTDVLANWDQVIVEMRRHFHFNAVLFGQESVGKTTVSRQVAQRVGGTWLPEYARPYLEEVGEELSLVKMQGVHRGQAALQSMTRHTAATAFAVYDTDLFSTVGYYRLMGAPVPQECLDAAVSTASEVYYVMPDDIPLVPDPLRYGDGVRESETVFWTDILEEFGCQYVLVPSGSVEDKTQFIAADMKARFHQRMAAVTGFQRD
jgi:HTH-type transcriptional repressor of NAD biosynthesis genes